MAVILPSVLSTGINCDEINKGPECRAADCEWNHSEHFCTSSEDPTTGHHQDEDEDQDEIETLEDQLSSTVETLTAAMEEKAEDEELQALVETVETLTAAMDEKAEDEELQALVETVGELETQVGQLETRIDSIEETSIVRTVILHREDETCQTFVTRTPNNAYDALRTRLSEWHDVIDDGHTVNIFYFYEKKRRDSFEI